MRNSIRDRVWVTLAMAVILLTASSALAKPEFFAAFLEEYPWVVGTRLESCQVCHTIPPRRNPYGTDFNLAGRVFSAIESLDSDGDGANNLSEIQGLTFPGDAADGPNSSPSPTATSTLGPTNTPQPTQTRAPTPTIVPGPCYGDCDDNGVVAVNELVLAVNIALDKASVDACPLADTNGNGSVSVDELVRAVNRALFGCPAPAL